MALATPGVPGSVLMSPMALDFCHYDFARFHKTLRCTPAMEAGVVSSPMTVKDLIEVTV